MAGSQKTRRPVWVESGSPAVRARFDREPPFPLHFRPLEESADRRDPLVAREQTPSLCPPTWVYCVVSGRSWRKARAKPMFRKAGLGRKWDFPSVLLRACRRIHTFGQNRSVAVTFRFNEINPIRTKFRPRPQCSMQTEPRRVTNALGHHTSACVTATL